MIQETAEVIPARARELRRYDGTALRADPGCGREVALIVRDDDDGTPTRYLVEGGRDMLMVHDATRTWLSPGVFRGYLGTVVVAPWLEHARC